MEAHKTNHQRRSTLQKLLTWMVKNSLSISPPPTALEINLEVSLSPKLLELERRINQTMIVNIANGIKTALKPIQESIDNIQKSSENKRLGLKNSPLKMNNS